MPHVLHVHTSARLTTVDTPSRQRAGEQRVRKARDPMDHGGRQPPMSQGHHAGLVEAEWHVLQHAWLWVWSGMHVCHVLLLSRPCDACSCHLSFRSWVALVFEPTRPQPVGEGGMCCCTAPPYGRVHGPTAPQPTGATRLACRIRQHTGRPCWHYLISTTCLALVGSIPTRVLLYRVLGSTHLVPCGVT